MHGCIHVCDAIVCQREARINLRYPKSELTWAKSINEHGEWRSMPQYKFKGKLPSTCFPVLQDVNNDGRADVLCGSGKFSTGRPARKCSVPCEWYTDNMQWSGNWSVHLNKRYGNGQIGFDEKAYEDISDWSNAHTRARAHTHTGMLVQRVLVHT